MSDSEAHDLERLRALMRRLRHAEHGCPWDLEQSFETIAPYTVEEAYEVEDAIRRGAWRELCGELGDLLLQVVYHTQLAEEAGHFQWADVVGAISSKLIRRHPHVFGDAARPTPESAPQLWETLKAEERAERGHTSAFDDVPRALPALLRAAKLERRALRSGLADPPDREPGSSAPGSSERELLERLEATVGPLDAERLGELLSLLAREAARRDLDPEALVRGANARLEARLRARERDAAALQDSGTIPSKVDSTPRPSDTDA